MKPIRAVIAAVSAAVLTAGALVATASPALATSQTITASADAYVKQDRATNNFGTQTLDELLNSATGKRWTYLKFPVTVPAGETITSATITLNMTKVPSPQTVSVYATTNSWTETGITWNTKPVAGTLQQTKTPTGTGALTFTVNAVAGDNSFVVQSSNTSVNSQFSAREVTTASLRPQITVVSSGGGPTNVAPTVNAGTDQTITLPSTANLDGTITDDGLPNPPAATTAAWSKVSGPGTVTFGNSSAVDTTATFSVDGAYVLRLTGSDSALSTTDDVAITVNPQPAGNTAPVVNAGPDQTITLPSGVTLDGTITDDGLPNPPAATTAAWSKVSGPGTVTFGNASAVDTTATFSINGAYVLRLTGSDSALSTQDDIAVTVNPAAGGALSISVSGNHLVNGQGQTVQLHGVNRSGTQYACMEGWGIFDGPSDQASVDAMASWHMNAVRVNGNEDCALGINGVPAAYAGTNYINALKAYIAKLHAAGMYVIMDLHHNAPGTLPATDAYPMPDRDHSPAYWTLMANSLKDDPAVIFDLYNEPWPQNGANTNATWTCIRDGGTACNGMGFSYTAAGMQEMMNNVRATGATNVVMTSGPNWAGYLDQWMTYKPVDSLNQQAASVHVYAPPLDSPYGDPATWTGDILTVAAQYPVVVGEGMDTNCTHATSDQWFPFADQHGISYLFWAWITGSCAGEPALISNYNGTPTAYGVGLRDHMLTY